jgi:hypothetical protein
MAVAPPAVVVTVVALQRTALDVEVGAAVVTVVVTPVVVVAARVVDAQCGCPFHSLECSAAIRIVAAPNTSRWPSDSFHPFLRDHSFSLGPIAFTAIGPAFYSASFRRRWLGLSVAFSAPGGSRET